MTVTPLHPFETVYVLESDKRHFLPWSVLLRRFPPQPHAVLHAKPSATKLNNSFSLIPTKETGLQPTIHLLTLII
jgi:hypothetical protein